MMQRLCLAALLAAGVAAAPVLSAGPARADDTCHAKAVGSDGKPLAGAALKSFLAKCTKDVCEPKAVDKNGKPLAGAARTSFLKKCQADA